MSNYSENTATLAPPVGFEDPALKPSGSQENLRYAEQRANSASDPVQDTFHRTVTYRLTHEVEGEEYTLTHTAEGIELFHERWGIVGEGANLLEAEQDAIQYARELADAMLQIPASELAPDALELRNYLLDII
ncbi:MAG: hypothetical protein GVY18_04440 [Bacteroidetes bacterium]|jgi:hypothetical protein|nr:hypothetical protein [Bacteroidota bacterium]